MGLSAKKLGEYLGLTSEQTNVLLKERGFLAGEPNNYHPTEKGKEYYTERGDDNGYGGYAFRGWNWGEWSENIISLLNITPEERDDIIQKTTEQRRARREEKTRESEEYWQKIQSRKSESSAAQPINDSEDNLAVGLLLVVAFGVFKLVKSLFNKD